MRLFSLCSSGVASSPTPAALKPAINASFAPFRSRETRSTLGSPRTEPATRLKRRLSSSTRKSPLNAMSTFKLDITVPVWIASRLRNMFVSSPSVLSSTSSNWSIATNTFLPGCSADTARKVSISDVSTAMRPGGNSTSATIFSILAAGSSNGRVNAYFQPQPFNFGKRPACIREVFPTPDSPTSSVIGYVVTQPNNSCVSAPLPLKRLASASVNEAMPRKARSFLLSVIRPCSMWYGLMSSSNSEGYPRRLNADATREISSFIRVQAVYTVSSPISSFGYASSIMWFWESISQPVIAFRAVSLGGILPSGYLIFSTLSATRS